MATHWRKAGALVVASSLALAGCPADPPGTPPSNAITLGAAGNFGNGITLNVGVSLDGTVAAFTSTSTDLIGNDTNGAGDIFVRDRSTATTVRIVEGTSGGPNLRVLRVSTDGRFITYSSNNLGAVTYYAHDRADGSTLALPSSIPNLAFVALADSAAYAIVGSPYHQVLGGGGCAIVTLSTGVSSDCDPTGTGDAVSEVSPNGRYMMVRSYGPAGPQEAVVDALTGARIPINTAIAGELTGGLRRVSNDGHRLVVNSLSTGVGPVVYDVASGATQSMPGPIADGIVFGVDISPDANLVAIISDATNLVSGDTNGHADFFIWDRAAGTVTRRSADVTSAFSASAPRHVALDTGTHLVADGTRLVDLTLGALESADTNTLYDAYLIPTG